MRRVAAERLVMARRVESRRRVQMLRNVLPAVCLCVLSLGASGTGAAHGGHGTPLEHFGWLKDLAGACWVGEHPDGTTRDTQCYRIQFGRFLYGTIRIVELHDGRWRPGFEGDSVLAWDETNQRLSYWYWGSSGAFGPAEAYVVGKQIHFPAPRRPGSTAPEVRSSWTRIDADSYRVSRQEQEAGKWKEIFAVTYRRART